MSAPPFVIAVTGAKTFAGRTTTATTLAWALGQQGLVTLLVDGNRYPTLSPGKAPCGEQPWPNVVLGSRKPGEAERVGAQVVVIDAPALNDKLAPKVLGSADAVLLCVLPKAQALRTLPAGIEVLAQVEPERMLGWILTGHDEANDHHRDLHVSIRKLLERWHEVPSIPLDAGLAEWPPLEGQEPPIGPGRDAYLELVSNLAEHLPEPAAPLPDAAPEDIAAALTAAAMAAESPHTAPGPAPAGDVSVSAGLAPLPGQVPTELLGLVEDPHMRQLFEAWPRLPEKVRRALASLARSSAGRPPKSLVGTEPRVDEHARRA